MDRKSVIIIGGGLGGLMTASILSKEGVEVTVLEKNASPGGGLQSFTRFGEVFDTGMHIIGGMQEGGNVKRIFDWLGLTGKLEIKDEDPSVIDEIYFAEDGRKYRIAQGRENFADVLSEQFPGERSSIEAYLEAMYRIVDEVDLFRLRKPESDFPVHSDEFVMASDAFVAKYINNKKLRSVLSYLNPFFGGQKNMTPAYIHALISVLYMEGSSRFVGGSQRCADTLVSFIREHGGKVLCCEAVTQVVTDNKTISRVVSSKGKVYSADIYVCAIHPCTFIKLLDDESALPKLYRNRLENLPNTYSAFTLNIKLKKDSFRYINHSCYYMARYDDIWDFGDRTAARNWPLGFLYMTPPEINQGEFSTKMIVTAPMLWSEVEAWKDSKPGHRPEEYVRWKNERAGILLGIMEKTIPGFNDCIEEFDTSSPLSIRDWYGVKEGSMCGFSKDYANLTLTQIPVFTKIPNLLLTGQNCNLHGFCGVSLTAINTSEAILGRNYVLDRINKQ